MDSSWCCRLLLVVVTLTGVLNDLGSWMVTAYEPVVPPQQTPRPMPYQYTGINRAGTGVALVLGCLIVPAGLIGFLVLVIHKCVTVCREMRKSKTKDAPIFKDPSERVKWQSAMLLYIDDKSEKAGKSDEDIGFEETTM
ncbi:uncharacterized protein [Asterias amurensis]|uniref:uncharacterized protein n=1 Tax=Asterias amurensis TaxID=7602 RepID=UPI003AB7B643